MKHFILLFSAYSLITALFAQTGYIEYPDIYNSDNGAIARANDGNIVCTFDPSWSTFMYKVSLEGNIIWQLEIPVSSHPFSIEKIFPVAGDGYYVLFDDELAHVTEDGNLISVTNFTVEDFGYALDDFEGGIYIDDTYFTGSGFVCVAGLTKQITDYIQESFMLNFEIALDGSVISHSLRSLITAESSAAYNFRLLNVGGYDHVIYSLTIDVTNHIVNDKLIAGTGTLEYSYSVLANFHDVYDLTNAFIVTEDEWLGAGFQYRFTKIDMDGDTIWTNTIISTEDALEEMGELESGNYICYYEDLNYLNDTTAEWLQYISPDGDSIAVNPPFINFNDFGWEGDYIQHRLVLGPNLIVCNGFNYTSDKGFLLFTDTLGHFYHVNLTGRLYHDLNANEIFDTGETVFSSSMIKSEPLTYYAYTNEDGIYNMMVGKDTSYNLSVLPITGWDIVDPDPLYFTTTIAMDGDTISGNDFTLDYNTAIHDVNVVTYQTAINPGFPSQNTITINNLGNQPNESGTVTLSYPSLLKDAVSLPDYLTHIDTIITWNFSGLDPFESETFQTDFITDTIFALVGSNVNIIAEVDIDATDVYPDNNIEVLEDIVVGSFDPNHKLVAPVGEGEDGDIDASTPSLTYTIEFQNTGNTATQFINIYDTLDTDLDIESVEMLSASHNYELIITSPNILRWKFDPIILPDSSSDLLGSMGYLKFKVKLKYGAVAGDVIENTAGIYFDYNPAIITNTAKNTLVYPTNLIEENLNTPFIIYPNPTNKYVTVGTKLNIDTDINISITDIAGNIVCSIVLPANTNSHTFDISKYASGTYLISFLTKDNVAIESQRFTVVSK